jgi:Na+/proline symporter
MSPLSSTAMTLAILGYGVGLFSLTWLTRKRKETAEGFVIADRRVGLGMGAASLLATWIAGSSLYIPAQCGYRYGVAGPFIWSLGGALMLCAFVAVVPRIRTVVPNGHTLPEYIGVRFGAPVHLLVTLQTLLLAPVSIYFQLAVPAYLASTLSPVSYESALLLVGLCVTAYTLVSGLKASILSDSAQLIAISLLGIVIAPVVFHKAGGATALAAALPGLGEKGTLLSRPALLRLGLPFLIDTVTVAVLLPPLWQRVWALERRQVNRAFVAAGLGWFPYALTFGMFGVVALVHGITSQSGDGNDICPIVAAHYLPPVLALAFAVVVISASGSTCDSFLSAFSSIAIVDVWKRYVRPRAADREQILVGRIAMLVCMALAVRFALAQFAFVDLVWIMGAVRNGMVFPLVASLWWPRVGPLGFIGGAVVGGAGGVAANLLTKGATPLYATIGLATSLALGAGVCALCTLVERHRFDFANFRRKVSVQG